MSLIKSSAPPTKAPDSRNIDETFHWIKQQVEAYSGSAYQVSYAEKGYMWHHTNSYHDLRLNDCVMVFDQTYQNNARDPRSVEYTVGLWDLASASYEIDSGNKQFQYTPGIPALFLRSHSNSMHWTRPRTYMPTNLAEIEFGRDPSFGKDKIDELAKAFRHLGDLCLSHAPKNDQSVKPTPQK